MIKYGVIYKITNIKTKKSYIGQTIRENPLTRINAHFVKNRGLDLVYRSYCKYGREFFIHEILCTTFNRENLDILEKYFIKTYNTLVPNGYNINLGGNGRGSTSEYTRNKISQKAKGRPSKLKGIPKTVQHRQKMSEVRKGFTSENRIKSRISSAFKMRKPVKALNIKTGEIRTFSGVEEAGKLLNIHSFNISRVCNNKQGRKQAQRWKFEFILVDKKDKV